MGDMPLMTDNGTFVVNGTERVIVSQMHRSPGVFFDHDRGKTHSSGKFLYSARIIPYRGSWLDFEFDAKDLAHVRIDRRRKLPVTTLLLALGLDQETILNTFYHEIFFARAGQGWRTAFRPDRLRGQKLTADLVDAATGQTLAEAGTKMTPRLLKKIEEQGMQRGLPLRRGAGRPLSEPRPDQRGDRPGPGRGRRRAHRRGHAQAGRGRDRDDPDPRHRPPDRRPLHPQHAGARPLPEPRGGAARHLPGAAPGRAADAGYRRGAVLQPDLRFRALRPVPGRPGQDEHAPRASRPRTRCACCAPRTWSPSSRCWSRSRTAAARSTTSIISATGACARSAS